MTEFEYLEKCIRELSLEIMETRLYLEKKIDDKADKNIILQGERNEEEVN